MSWQGALGTHTAFLLLLPCLFWFDSGSTMEVHGQSVDKNRVYGRSLVLMLAAGVYLSGAAKDYIGLPRPLSPPVVRMSTSASIDVEYGFPSTHTANAVSLSLFTSLFFHRYWADSWSESSQTVIYSVLVTYSILIAISRIVTGMHTLLDVVGGALVGGGIVLIHWFWLMAPMEEWLMSSWTVPLVMIPLCILLISVHPDPEGPCPCFDDSVAFVGVLGGLMIGNWHYAIYSANFFLSAPSFGLLMVFQRITCGISIIVAWRITTKRVCYTILPPLYRVLALPFGRKFFALADKDYKSIPASHVSFAPSVLHLASTEQLRFRLPRYDVDIAAKLIVYCGIGWLAVEFIPYLFYILGI
ncbi:PAP2 superfamily-domain-containing protein [Powellomyces hirtus]|nr:PAP2 superfamily-domain-containing protein [Powellomyces hirtus]